MSHGERSSPPPARPAGLHLRLEAVSAGYGSGDVISDIDLEVRAGEAVAILGPNGAGKTTLVRAVLGMIRASGVVSLDGEAWTDRRPHRAAARGIAIVPEGRRVFPTRTVEQNLWIGAWNRHESRSVVRHAADEMLDRFPLVARRRTSPAAALSGGEVQILALAMALLSEPRMIILDEPSMGLAPLVADQLMSEVQRIAASGVSVLLVEQNVKKALRVVDRGYVLGLGRIRANGTATELREAVDLAGTYLGATPSAGRRPASRADRSGDDRGPASG